MQAFDLPTYSIYVGDDSAAQLARFVGTGDFSRVIVLVDDNTGRFCLPLLRPYLPEDAWCIRIPAGEAHKNIATCGRIWEGLLAAGADRRALLVNLGGGVVGDMGGFCAATYKRGIRFVQVPTTLLAQVDASIGGKLGIDFGGLKNSVGLFGDPAAVFIRPALLKTLPFRELRSGFAEIVKHGLIADRGLWQHIAEGAQDLNGRNWEALILSSLRIKQHFVAADPFEKGIRKALNFGHTVGHALESASLDTTAPLLHGEAVAIGMVCESWLSYRLAGLGANEVAAISGFLLAHFGTWDIRQVSRETLFERMRQDKKNAGRQIRCALLPAIGSVLPAVDCEAALLAESLDYYKALGQEQ